MSAAIKFQALGATPQERAVALVHALCAAAAGARRLNKANRRRASQLVSSILTASEVGGFSEMWLLMMLAPRPRLSGLLLDLVTEVVAHVGGPENLFALIDLVTAPTDWIGFPQ